jgi:hypothetical protein
VVESGGVLDQNRVVEALAHALERRVRRLAVLRGREERLAGAHQALLAERGLYLIGDDGDERAAREDGDARPDPACDAHAAHVCAPYLT